MGRFLKWIWAVVLTVGIIACLGGCGAQAPQKAKELVPQLNDALEKQEIPVEFVFAVEEQVSDSLKRSIYQASVSEGELSQSFDISVYYAQSLSDSIERIELWIEDGNASQEEKELFHLVSAVLGQLCDEFVSKEQILKLLETEPLNIRYIIKNGDISQFTISSSGIYQDGSVFQYRDFCAFFQPKALTHSLLWLRDWEKIYRINFTSEGEELYAAYEIPYLTVGEFEERLNAELAARNIPLEYDFQRTDAYMCVDGKATYTQGENPFVYHIDDALDDDDAVWFSHGDHADAWNELFREYYRNRLENPLDELDILLLTNYSEDLDESVIREIDFSSYYYLEGSQYCHSAQDQILELYLQLISAVLAVCDDQITQEQVDSALAELEWATFLSEMEQKSGFYYEPNQTGLYGEHVTAIFNDLMKRERGSGSDDTVYEMHYIQTIIYFQNIQEYNGEIPTGEALLDPKYLDYEFELLDSIIEDGTFRSIFPFVTKSGGYVRGWTGNALHDYFKWTMTPLRLAENWDLEEALGDEYMVYSFTPVAYRSIYATELEREWPLSPAQFFVVEEYKYREHILEFVSVGMFYSTAEKHYLTESEEAQIFVQPEYVIRGAVGLSMLYDEGMTVEEAILLHTNGMESMDTYVTEHGVRYSCYCPRDVVHVLYELESEEGEDNVRGYFIMTKEYFDRAYGSLEAYVYS